MKGVPVELSFSQPSRLVVYCDEYIGVQYENGWMDGCLIEQAANGLSSFFPCECEVLLLHTICSCVCLRRTTFDAD
jgi:hypothetical protein